MAPATCSNFEVVVLVTSMHGSARIAESGILLTSRTDIALLQSTTYMNFEMRLTKLSQLLQA